MEQIYRPKCRPSTPGMESFRWTSCKIRAPRLKLNLSAIKQPYRLGPLASYCPPGALTCTLPVSPAIRPYLDLFQRPNTPAGLDGTAYFLAAPLQVTHEDYVMGRVDHQISDRMRIFARYSLDKDTNALPNYNGSSVADHQDVARRQYSTIQV